MTKPKEATQGLFSPLGLSPSLRLDQTCRCEHCQVRMGPPCHRPFNVLHVSPLLQRSFPTVHCAVVAQRVVCHLISTFWQDLATRIPRCAVNPVSWRRSLNSEFSSALILFLSSHGQAVCCFCFSSMPSPWTEAHKQTVDARGRRSGRLGTNRLPSASHGLIGCFMQWRWPGRGSVGRPGLAPSGLAAIRQASLDHDHSGRGASPIERRKVDARAWRAIPAPFPILPLAGLYPSPTEPGRPQSV